MKGAPQCPPKEAYHSPEFRAYGDVATATLTGGKGTYDVLPNPSSAGRHSTHKTGNG